MARQELQQLGIREAVTSYRQARSSVEAEKGIPQPLRGLDVARRFVREQTGDSSGILVELGALHSILRVVPPAIALITDPQTSADLLRHSDFTALTSDHPTYQAFKPYVGEYIVFKYTKGEWLEDRRAAAIPFSQQEMDHERSLEVSRDGLESVIGLASDDTLPGNWIKYLTSYQVVRHVTGQEVDPAILSGAVNAHSTFTGKTLREVLIGTAPKSIGKIISYPTLRRYHRLKHELAEREPSGILEHVMENLPEGRRDAADISASLIGGLSTTRSYMEILLYVLAKNPQLQNEALQNPSLLKRIMKETARAYPAAPYILRKAKQDIPLGNTTIPRNSLVVFGIFAFGNNPEINDPEQFDPNREGLEEMFTTQGGAANVFSYGPRACLGRHLGTEILEATTQTMLERYEIRCLNEPILMIGKGIASSFDRPVQFQLIDRSTKRQISATST